MSRFPAYTCFAFAKLAILVILPLVWVGPMGRNISADELQTLGYVIVGTIGLTLPFCAWADWMTRN